MEKEFNWKDENYKFYSKWLGRKLTGRAIHELGTSRKEFIKMLELNGHIDLGRDRLSIKYSKFKELVGEELS